MNSFRTEGTNITPKVILSVEDREFSISGKSFPENAEKLYLPLLEWLQELGTVSPIAEPLEFRFALEYINSSSVHWILESIQELVLLNKKGFDFSVVWCYLEEDEDMKEIGEDFNNLNPIDFKMIGVTEY